MVDDNSGNDDREQNKVKTTLAGTMARIDDAIIKKTGVILEGDRRVAKNRIALFVIKTFCISIVLVILFIMVGSLFSGTESWKEAYPPMFDILQKIFLPVVTLAFGFYNATDRDE